MPDIDVGDVVKVTGEFRNTAGALTDPATITLKVKPWTESPVTYTYADGEITRESAGIYSKNLTITSSGRWHYRFIGTGAVAAAEEEYFIVENTAFS